MTNAKTVGIVDGDCAVRHSLSFFLESAGLETASFSSAELFLKSADPRVFGCLISGIHMPGMSGIELLSHCRTKHPTLPVIMIAAIADLDIVVEAMKMGAFDFLIKPCENERFLEAVCTALARSQRDEIRDYEFNTRESILSMRERDVLACILKGSANKVIASELGISVRTVEIHRGRVMTKMGARNAADLVRLVMSVEGAAKLAPLYRGSEGCVSSEGGLR